MSGYYTVCDCVREALPPGGGYYHMPAATMRLRRAMESLDDLVANYIDPDDAFVDDASGERWLSIGAGDNKHRVPFNSEEGLSEIRNKCRDICLTNEFAINCIENRISYVVGSGHSYSVVEKKKGSASEEEIAGVQDIIDEWIADSRWNTRQQENTRRVDRDGEVFIRTFIGSDGIVKLRYVEPDQVYRPKSVSSNDAASFGILTDPNDVETVLGYYVDGEYVNASEIQHRKANVDCNVKRGLPLLFPVRANLQRAERLLRNMAAVAEIQAAIAWIRKHNSGTQSDIAAWVQSQADQSVTNTSARNTTRYYRHYGPGTILDSTASMEYEFPNAHVNPSVFVPVLQAELRAIASRLVMPEFMLTSDASNANYASTMVAEGPAVRMFQRLQWNTIEYDLELLDRVLDSAVMSGRISKELRDKIGIDVEPPRMEVRDRYQEANADVLLVRERVLSRHTCQLRHELDPDNESEWIKKEREENDPYAGMEFPDMNQGQDNRQGDKYDDAKDDADSQ